MEALDWRLEKWPRLSACEMVRLVWSAFLYRSTLLLLTITFNKCYLQQNK